MGRLDYTEEEILDLGIRDAYAKDKDSAADSGIGFFLTFQQFKNKIFLPCFGCGKSGSMEVTSQHKRIGLDRKDLSKHLTAANTIPCCRFCYAARRKIHPKMIIHAILINRQLKLINSKNMVPKKRKKKNGIEDKNS